MDERRKALLSRLAVFAVALLVRGVLAWTFFGSTDTANDLTNSARMFSGWRGADVLVPYLPGIQLIIWVSGVLVTYTALPLTFPYKFFGSLFDALLAVAIYDYFAADRRRAFRAGLLYALAPIPVIVAAIHGQRDGMSLAFLVLAFLLVARKTHGASAAAGGAFVLSMIVKPITIPLLPLLFPAPWTWNRDEERRRVYAITGGAAAVFIAYVFVLIVADEIPELWRLHYILEYSERGVGISGLPLALDLRSRVLSMPPLIIPLVVFWKGWLSRERAAAVMYAWLLGTGSYSSQYLLWLFPFLLLARHFRFAAVHGALAGLFLIIHYSHPGPTRFNFHNLGALGPRLGWDWLAPAATYLGEKSALYVLVGGLLTPLACTAFAVFLIVQRLRQRTQDEAPAPAVSMRTLLAPFAAALLVLVLALGYALTKPEPTVPQFTRVIATKVRDYAVHRYRGPGLHEPDEPTWVIQAFALNVEKPPARAIDAVSIGYAWVAAWSIAAWLAARGVR